MSDMNCKIHPEVEMVMGFGSIIHCPTCTQEVIDGSESELVIQDEQRHKEIDKKIKLRRWEKLDIGIRFRQRSFDDYEEVNAKCKAIKKICQKYSEKFKDRLAEGDNLVMLGTTGTGKNHLSASICRVLIEDDYLPVHTTAIKLVRSIKDSWKDKTGRTEQDVINQYIEPDLLVIDEVGIQFGSQTELIFLMDVINSRYADMKPTILISNLDVGKLKKILGEPIVSRFYEGKSAVLNFDWEDYRKKKA